MGKKRSRKRGAGKANDGSAPSGPSAPRVAPIVDAGGRPGPLFRASPPTVGRDALVRELAEATVARGGFLMLYGPAGVGRRTLGVAVARHILRGGDGAHASPPDAPTAPAATPPAQPAPPAPPAAPAPAPVEPEVFEMLGTSAQELRVSMRSLARRLGVSVNGVLRHVWMSDLHRELARRGAHGRPGWALVVKDVISNGRRGGQAGRGRGFSIRWLREWLPPQRPRGVLVLTVTSMSDPEPRWWPGHAFAVRPLSLSDSVAVLKRCGDPAGVEEGAASDAASTVAPASTLHPPPTTAQLKAVSRALGGLCLGLSLTSAALWTRRPVTHALIFEQLMTGDHKPLTFQRRVIRVLVTHALQTSGASTQAMTAAAEWLAGAASFLSPAPRPDSILEAFAARFLARATADLGKADKGGKGAKGKAARGRGGAGAGAGAGAGTDASGGDGGGGGGGDEADPTRPVALTAESRSLAEEVRHLLYMTTALHRPSAIVPGAWEWSHRGLVDALGEAGNAGGIQGGAGTAGEDWFAAPPPNSTLELMLGAVADAGARCIDDDTEPATTTAAGLLFNAARLTFYAKARGLVAAAAKGAGDLATAASLIGCLDLALTLIDNPLYDPTEDELGPEAGLGLASTLASLGARRRTRTLRPSVDAAVALHDCQIIAQGAALQPLLPDLEDALAYAVATHPGGAQGARAMVLRRFVALARPGTREGLARRVTELEELVRLRTSSTGGTPHWTWVADLVALSDAHSLAGNALGTVEAGRRAVEVAEALWGPRHSNLAVPLRCQAAGLDLLDKVPEQIECFRRAVDVMERHDPTHPLLASAKSQLEALGGLQTLTSSPEADQSSAHLDVATRIANAEASADSAGPPLAQAEARARALYKLGCALLTEDDMDGAQEALTRALRHTAGYKGGVAPNVLRTLGHICATRGDRTGAVVHLRRALWAEEMAYGPDSPQLAATLLLLAKHQGEAGERRRQVEGLRRGLRLTAVQFGDDSVELVAFQLDLAGALLGRPEAEGGSASGSRAVEAAGLARQAAAAASRDWRDNPGRLAGALSRAAALLMQAHDHVGAQQVQKQLARLTGEVLGAHSLEVVRVLVEGAQWHMAEWNFGAAVAFARQALEAADSGTAAATATPSGAGSGAGAGSAAAATAGTVEESQEDALLRADVLLSARSIVNLLPAVGDEDPPSDAATTAATPAPAGDSAEGRSVAVERALRSARDACAAGDVAQCVSLVEAGKAAVTAQASAGEYAAARGGYEALLGMADACVAAERVSTASHMSGDAGADAGAGTDPGRDADDGTASGHYPITPTTTDAATATASALRQAFLLNISLMCAKEGDWHAAMAAARRAVALDGASLKARYRLATAAMGLGDLATAGAECEAGLRLELSNKALRRLRRRVVAAVTAAATSAK